MERRNFPEITRVGLGTYVRTVLRQIGVQVIPHRSIHSFKDFRSLLLLEIADNTMGGGGESRLEQILLEQFHSHFKSSQLQLSPPLSTSVGQQLHPWLVGILSSRYYELALGFVGEIERETMRTLNAPHVKQLEPHDLAPALNSLGQLFVRWKVLALYPSSSSQATRCSLSSLVKLAIKRCVALNSATPFPLPHPPPLLIHSCEYHHLIYAKCLQDFLQNIKKFDA